jgi:hypothetical protein
MRLKDFATLLISYNHFSLSHDALRSKLMVYFLYITKLFSRYDLGEIVNWVRDEFGSVYSYTQSLLYHDSQAIIGSGYDLVFNS